MSHPATVQPDQIRAAIAPMLSLRPEDITSATPLTGLQTSLAGARLKIALKRLGLELPKGPTPASFGALERLLTGSAGASPEPAAQTATPFRTSATPTSATPTPGLPAGIAGGIDVQQISDLPVTSDFWTHEWYAAMFSPAEIAWAVTSAEPREHFAGFWCAKEALRKCSPQFRDVAPRTTFIAHEEDGRPFLSAEGPSGPTRLPHIVSISHSGPVATALVIQVPEPVSSPPDPTVLPASPVASAARTSALRRLFPASLFGLT